MSNANTIFALATPPGKSGIAVIRLSGPQSLPALKRLTGLADVTPRLAQYTAFRINDTIIDRGLAIYFPAPNSFTGENVVELQLHGSLAVIREMLAALSSLEGLRPAESGEFSRRAFLNGKMDLVEAEGLADLIDAETLAQKRQAQHQMDGALSHRYEDLRRRMTGCLALLEAYIDFPDEDIPESVLNQLHDDIAGLQSVIAEALDDGYRGERLRDGIRIVILGAPNAGKSSLLNILARRDAAIVSARAGTTRDVIEVHLDIAGYPVVLMDTAGIREASDEIEEEGVRRALQRAVAADIRLVLFDGAVWPRQDPASLALLDDRAIAIISKSDLLKGKEGLNLSISTQTGQGIGKLLSIIENRIISAFSLESAPLITRERHRALLNEALHRLTSAQAKLPLELKCEELRQAAHAMGKITGQIRVDDVLDVIFRQFCIGK